MSHFRYTPRGSPVAPQRVDQDGEPEPVASVPVRRAKVMLNSVCVCGHQRRHHCLQFACFHWPQAEGQFGFFCCRFEHCTLCPRDGSCHCAGFRLQAGDPIEPKRPRVNDYTACVTCGHWRAHHCRVQRTESQETGFFVGTTPYLCKHFDKAANPPTYRCTSTSCAMDDCACQEFVSPYARKRKAAPNKPVARKPRSRRPKAVAADAQLFLFSDACEDQPHA